MYTKRLKKIAALITAIVICITCVTNVTGCRVVSEFEKKVSYGNILSEYIKDKSDELDTEKVCVELHYEETFSTTLEKATPEYVQALCSYYKDLNEERFESLNLIGYDSYYAGMLDAYVQINYSSYNAWMKEDYAIIASANPPDLISVSVSVSTSEMRPEPAADVSDLYYTYKRYSDTDDSDDFSIYKDLGIPESGNLYNGGGIKVGILEMALPEGLDNNYQMMLPSNYDTSGYTDEDIQYYKNHAYWVYSILGSSTGIVPAVDLCFSAFLGGDTLKPAIELLVSSGVNIINMSITYADGLYRNVSKYIDDVIENTGVVMVVSAGNGGDGVLINSYSTSLNSICVGSTNFDLSSSAFSVNNKGNLNGQYELLKPTISAPGANIGTFGGVYGLTGTSFSAPVVTGVIAMLMDEFPALIGNPKLVVPLLTNTAAKARGQTDIIDEDVGYGIINYARARQYYNNLFAFAMTTEYSASTDVVYEKSVYVPVGSKLKVTSFVLNDVYNFIYNENTIFNPSAPEFTPIYVTVQNQSTWEIGGGECYSNFSSVEIVNNGPRTAEYKIRVYTDIDKDTTEYEHCGIHYIVESTAAKPHEHRYTDRIEQMSGSLHKWYCSCGNSITEYHTWESAGIGQTMKCKWCKYDSGVMINGTGGEDHYEK